MLRFQLLFPAFVLLLSATSYGESQHVVFSPRSGDAFSMDSNLKEKWAAFKQGKYQSKSSEAVQLFQKVGLDLLRHILPCSNLSSVLESGTLKPGKFTGNSNYPNFGHAYQDYAYFELTNRTIDEMDLSDQSCALLFDISAVSFYDFLSICDEWQMGRFVPLHCAHLAISKEVETWIRMFVGSPTPHLPLDDHELIVEEEVSLRFLKYLLVPETEKKLLEPFPLSRSEKH